MFNRNRCLLKFIYSRCYTTKSQRSVLLQDVEKCPTYEFPTSNKSTRRVYVWGMSETGALGVNTDLKKHSKKHTAIVQHPTRLSFAERNNVLNIATGYGFTVFVTKYSEGYSLYGVGINSDSQLGYHLRGKNSKGNLELLIYPAPIDLPKSHEGEVIQITKCAAGRAHLLALSDKGVVYSLGNNAYGQCGRPVIENEDYRESSTVNRIETVGLTNEQIFDITCGQDHSLFLTKDGKVFGCGWGADGQTGLGMFQSIDKPARVLGDISSEKIVKVSGTVDCVLALNDKGELFGWGNSEYGQIGNEQQVNLPRYIETKGIGKIIDVASGGSYCVILNENGDVFVWGFGILGLGPNAQLITKPTQIPATLLGRNEFNRHCRVRSIHSGISHIGAVNDQNDVYMWGRNKCGCLGLGHKNDQYFPFKAAIGAQVLNINCGVDHTIALCQPFT